MLSFTFGSEVSLPFIIPFLQQQSVTPSQGRSRSHTLPDYCLAQMVSQFPPSAQWPSTAFAWFAFGIFPNFYKRPCRHNERKQAPPIS